MGSTGRTAKKRDKWLDEECKKYQIIVNKYNCEFLGAIHTPVIENANKSWGIYADDNVLASFGLKNLSNQGAIRNYRMNVYFERAIRRYVENKIEARRYSHTNPIGYLQSGWDSIWGHDDLKGEIFIGTPAAILGYAINRGREIEKIATYKKINLEKLKLSNIKDGIALKKSKDNSSKNSLIFGGYTNYAAGTQYSEGGAGSQTFTAASALNRSRGFDELSNDEITNATIEATIQNRAHVAAAGCVDYFSNVIDAPYPLVTKWAQKQTSLPRQLYAVLNARIKEIKDCISELCESCVANACGEALEALQYAIFHPSGAGVLIRQVAAAYEREQMENYNNALRCQVVEWESIFKQKIQDAFTESKKTADKVYNEEIERQKEAEALNELIFDSEAYTLDEKAAIYYANAYRLVCELSDAFDTYTDEETGDTETGEFYAHITRTGTYLGHESSNGKIYSYINIPIGENDPPAVYYSAQGYIADENNFSFSYKSWANFRADVLKCASSENLTEILTKNEICQIAREVMNESFIQSNFYQHTNTTLTTKEKKLSIRGYELWQGYVTNVNFIDDKYMRISLNNPVCTHQYMRTGVGNEYQNIKHFSYNLSIVLWSGAYEAPEIEEPEPSSYLFDIISQSYKFPNILEGYDFDKLKI